MFDFYEVGGKIRDEFLNLKSKDYDYSAVLQDKYLDTVDVKQAFSMLQNHLVEQGYEIFLVTPKALTIRAKIPKNDKDGLPNKDGGIVADFVLARKEIGYEEGTRNPIVKPGTLYDDLERRDFTVNAIAKDKYGIYHDPFHGMDDIKSRILRTPIQGSITFEDDPLRLIRAVRFCITKGFTMSSDIYYLVKYFDYYGRFHVVSEERIREELHKCFKANTYKTLIMLEEFKALRTYCFDTETLWLKPTTEE